MATRSAAKAHRQSLKRRVRNRAALRFTKTAVQQAEAVIPSGDIEAARTAVRRAIGALDRAAKKGVLHPSNAARRKSRLFLKFNAAVAALQAAPKPAPRKRPTRAAAKAPSRSKARSGGRKKAAK